MEDIATRARVSKGTLYNHFASKEDLLLAVVEDGLQLGTEIVAMAVGTAVEPRLALERTVEGLVEVIRVQSAGAPVVYQAWSLVAGDAELTRRLHVALEGFFTQWAASVRRIVQEGQAEGAFACNADGEAFVQAALALVSGFVFRGVFSPEAIRPDALHAAFDALFRQRLVPPHDPQPGVPR